MTTDRLTPDAVEAELVGFDARDRAVIGGQVVMDFVQVGVLASLLSPREWEDVAAYLIALVNRAPLATGPAYVGHRTLLGALAGELRQYARQAGEPVGLEVDLLSAKSKAEERRLRARLADQEAAFDRHIDDVIASHHAQADLPGLLDEPEEEPTDSPTPAAPTEPTTDADYLL